MDPTDIGIFHLAERRLAWVDQRQRLLAQNVANANTPGWTPRDMAPFHASLSASAPGSASALARTAPAHLQPAHLQPAGRTPGEATLRPQARAPGGNAVSIEGQLATIADTASMHELTLNLHRRYASMMRTAFGRPG